MQLLLSLLLCASFVKSIPREDVTEYTTLPPPTTTEAIPTYDYVVEIGFNLDEDKVPEYLVNVIYEQATERSITTDDIFTLYGLKTVDRTTTLTFLEKLGISTEKVFSLDGFDKFLTELRVDFKEFYNKVIIDKMNITGNPLRDVLVALNIDINNFSMGMAYGEPNPYDEFKKGTYTKESVTTALEKADRTFDDLFIACRDEFVSKALAFSPEKIVESLVRYQFAKDATLRLWNILGLTTENVYRVPGFKRLLNELNRELNRVPCLGVLTGVNNITINRKVYETWSDNEAVVQPFAESITRKFILQIVEKVETELDNIFLLKSVAIEPFEGDPIYINIGKTKNDLRNCKFVTLENQTIVTSDVSRASNHLSTFQIPKGNITNLVIGSPLICEDKVYGLAREISGEDIILDSFSSANKIFLNGHIVSIAIAVFACIVFL